MNYRCDNRCWHPATVGDFAPLSSCHTSRQGCVCPQAWLQLPCQACKDRQGCREAGRGTKARRPGPLSLPCHPGLSQLNPPWLEHLLDSRPPEFPKWACDHQTSTLTASPGEPVGGVCAQSVAFQDAPAERKHGPGCLKCSNGGQGTSHRCLAQGSRAGTVSPSLPPPTACQRHYKGVGH